MMSLSGGPSVTMPVTASMSRLAAADLGDARRHVGLHQRREAAAAERLRPSPDLLRHADLRPNIALYAFAIALALVVPQIAGALFLIIAVVGFVRTA
jgi:hypothetical protein